MEWKLGGDREAREKYQRGGEIAEGLGSKTPGGMGGRKSFSYFGYRFTDAWTRIFGPFRRQFCGRLGDDARVLRASRGRHAPPRIGSPQISPRRPTREGSPPFFSSPSLLPEF